MVDMATIPGGAHGGVTSLSPAERHAAINALSKLSGGSSHGVSSVFGGGLKSATLSGGSASNLVVGKGSDTFAGGVRSGIKPVIHAIGSDTVVAGSAFGKLELTNTGGGHALSGDTINVTGTTAAGVKTALDVKSSGHTITMADKTSITLSGITTHDVTKPH